MKQLLLLFFLVAGTNNLPAQDSSLLRNIDSLTRIGYDKPDTVMCFLTEKDLLSVGAGTEVYLYKYKQQTQRIVCFSHPHNRNVAIEFYPYHDTLLFVYENEEYAEEKTPPGAVKNVKGIASSEARFYFMNNQVIYWKGAGYSPSFSADEHALHLKKKFTAILRWYDGRKNKQSPPGRKLFKESRPGGDNVHHAAIAPGKQ